MIRPVDCGVMSSSQMFLMFDSRTLWHDANSIPWYDAMSASMKGHPFYGVHEGKNRVRNSEYFHHGSPQFLLM